MVLGSLREALDLVKEAISRTGYNERIKIAIDVAATNFCIGNNFNVLNYFCQSVASNFERQCAV